MVITFPTIFTIAHVLLIIAVAVTCYRAGLVRGRSRGRAVPYLDKDTADIIKGDYLMMVEKLLRQNTKIATTLAMLSDNAAKAVEQINKSVEQSPAKVSK